MLMADVFQRVVSVEPDFQHIVCQEGDGVDEIVLVFRGRQRRVRMVHDFRVDESSPTLTAGGHRFLPCLLHDGLRDLVATVSDEVPALVGVYRTAEEFDRADSNTLAERVDVALYSLTFDF